MPEEKTILLIENQNTHFTKIFTALDNAKYTVYPKQENYIKFIDLVRVALNPRYGEQSINSCKQKLLEKINTFAPQVIIIDHILVGNYFAQDGIDLAAWLREQDTYTKTPIFFLSNSNQSDFSVVSKLPNITEPKTWVSKGYAGTEILNNEAYLKEHLLEKLTQTFKDLDTERNAIKEKFKKEIQNLENSEIATQTSTRNRIAKLEYIVTNIYAIDMARLNELSDNINYYDTFDNLFNTTFPNFFKKNNDKLYIKKIYNNIYKI